MSRLYFSFSLCVSFAVSSFRVLLWVPEWRMQLKQNGSGSRMISITDFTLVQRRILQWKFEGPRILRKLDLLLFVSLQGAGLQRHFAQQRLQNLEHSPTFTLLAASPSDFFITIYFNRSHSNSNRKLCYVILTWKQVLFCLGRYQLTF